jgi:Flp pilus assembly protein TadG
MGKSVIMDPDPHTTPAAAPPRAWFRRTGRRGSVAVAFAVGATAVLGMVALATEGGVWYAARRNAQTAADLAAFAGVAQLAWRGQGNAGYNAAISVGASVAATNSFVTETDPQTGAAGRTTVTVTPGVWNWSTASFTASATNPTAVEVTIRQTQRLGIAGIFASTPPVVNVRGIAAIRAASDACILSLTGQTTITGNNTLNAPQCAVASNRPGPSIDCGNSATINVLALVAVGQAASECDGRGALVLEQQLPMADPYAHLQGVTLPTFRNNECQETRTGRANTIATSIATGTRYRPLPYNMSSTGPYTAATAICDRISIASGDELIFVPGTYFFYGENLKVTGGTVSCDGCTNGQGVTLVFTGPDNGNNSIGTLEITGGSVNLAAPTVGPWYNETYNRPDPASPGTIENTGIYDGILVYRDVRAGPNNSRQLDSINNPNTLRINGNADGTNLDGGIYAPSSEIYVAGTSENSSAQEDCQSMVAATIQFTGNSRLALTGCANRGTAITQTRVLRLVN